MGVAKTKYKSVKAKLKIEQAKNRQAVADLARCRIEVKAARSALENKGYLGMLAVRLCHLPADEATRRVAALVDVLDAIAGTSPEFYPPPPTAFGDSSLAIRLRAHKTAEAKAEYDRVFGE